MVSSDNINFRKINVDDADDLKRINDTITKQTSDTDFRKVIEEKQYNNGNDTSFVAERDGKVIGYLISNILYSGFGLEKSAWIVTLGVDPNYMGTGIGKKLAEKVFSVYREKGIKHIYSSVIWDSIDLLSYFKSLGFERSDFINLKKELEY